jgi:hypothetical protein
MQGEMGCALRLLYVKQFLHEIQLDERWDSLFLHPDGRHLLTCTGHFNHIL